MNKTIEINPALFTAGGSFKTKPTKPKSLKNKPIINPSVLKNKFLKRIKQHKSKELKDAYSSAKDPTNDLFTDEFSQSLDYLQQLSREKKKQVDNQFKKDSLEKKTVKNYNSVYNAFPNVNQTSINIELPSELTEQRYISPTPIPYISHTPTPTPIPYISHTPTPIPYISPPPMIKISTPYIDPPSIRVEPVQIQTDMPYGILKGGNKPTYRTWNKTLKNVKPSAGLNHYPIQPLSSREEKLNKLKNTIHEKHAIANNALPDQWSTSNFIKNTKSENVMATNDGPINNSKLKMSKKIITKRYTLGKSKIKRQIGVLIKDRETRKKVICAHKELKQQPICEIKTYLNEHNLIKIGSKAPTDVMRKLYETAKLSGDIFNLNNDTLLHNLKKSDDNN